MMRQPEPSNPIDDLREFLRFAVPLRAATIAHEHRGLARPDLAQLLTGMARRGGTALGSGGDALQFSDGRPRKGRQRDTVIRTADDLVTGVAAAVLLAQMDGHAGVTVLGDFYGGPPTRDADREGPQANATPGPRPVVDIQLPLAPPRAAAPPEPAALFDPAP